MSLGLAGCNDLSRAYGVAFATTLPGKSRSAEEVLLESSVYGSSPDLFVLCACLLYTRWLVSTVVAVLLLWGMVFNKFLYLTLFVGTGTSRLFRLHDDFRRLPPPAASFGRLVALPHFSSRVDSGGSSVPPKVSATADAALERTVPSEDI